MTRSSTPPDRSSGAAPPRTAGVRDAFGRYAAATADLPVAAALVLPLVVFYDIGLLVSPPAVMNGADFLSGALHRGLGPTGYFILHALFLAMAVALFVLAWRRGRVRLPYVPLLWVECLLYALLLEGALWLLGAALTPAGPRPGPLALGHRLVLSAGAGFHEELLFRLGLVTGLAWLLGRLTIGRHGLAVLLALGLAAVLFAAAHYLGPEPWSVRTFVPRVVAGLVFGVIFVGRGFAAACYCHAFYDVLVL